MSEQYLDCDSLIDLGTIYDAIAYNGFSKETIDLIDIYTKHILNGTTNLNQFNQQEHAGLCCAGEVLIGAYIVCCYAQASLRAGANVGGSQTSISNWEIDEAQETLIA